MGADKRQRVIEAAFQAFIRYGYRRVTMGDLAELAGMSRPALYLVFAGKEEIFNAVVTDFSSRALAEIRARMADVKTVEERLRLAFDVWTVRPFEQFHDSPDANDLVECAQGFARETIEAGYAGFEQLLTTIIEPMQGHHLSAPQIARTLAMAARGCKASARDTQDLRGLLATLITMALSVRDEKTA